MKIYLDNAATTKTDLEVAAAILPYMTEHFGNPSSVHQFGKKAKVLLEETRETVAGYLLCKPKEIFFTSCGTESNNTAIKGIACKFIDTKKNHIITSLVEHPSVLETVDYLKNQFGFKVTHVNPDKYGRISLESVEEAVRPETFLISIMHSHNELGTINDIKNISAIAEQHGLYFHSDTVQSIGKTEINLKGLNVNAASVSAHKIYGPKGIGILYKNENTVLEKFIHGGGQERDMRGGTENIPYIAGLKKVFELLIDKGEDDKKKYSELKKYFISEMKNLYGDKIHFNSPVENCLANIVNIRFDNSLKFDEEMLIIKFDLLGIAVSGGSACHSGALKPSSALLKIGYSEKEAMSSVRISFGRFNEKKEIDYFCEKVKEIITF
ncbi:MAG: cysteine desulfurase [Ignavibacteria bacterium]|nr:cysteine desulfurase [Ignavibacteria bacterium]